MTDLHQTLSWDNRFFRFLLVGGLNAAFGYGAFALLYFLGLHYAIAAFLATVAGILFNFFSTGRLVFRNSDNRLIVRFVLVYGIVYVVGVAELKAGLLIDVSPYLTGAVCLLPNAALAYILQRLLVFEQGFPSDTPAVSPSTTSSSRR